MKAFIFLFAIWSCSAWAQKAEPLIFNETVHDFGNVDENGGPAEFEFTFTNNSGRPITIISVSASCGCTTPGWTKESVDPGKKGFVKASFNPKGRPGFFDKTLAVNTNLNGPPTVLRIRGNVTNEQIDSDVSRLTASNGVLKMRAPEINFGKVFINRPAVTQEVTLFNSGTKPVSVDSIHAPAYIKVDVRDSIGAGQQTVMRVTYNAALKNQYGFGSDRIELITNDETKPRKSFPVFATVEEYFAPLTDEDADKVPVLSLEAGTVDFGAINFGSTVARSIKLRNTGKKELVIRFVQSNCPCVVVTMDKDRAKPGQEVKVTLSWTSEGKRGLQNKAITIYSTDPSSPVQRVALTANVN